MIIADQISTVIGLFITGVFSAIVAYLAYRQAKQKTEADSIRAQIAEGQTAMKDSQAIYENASKFSERQNTKLRIDLDAAYVLIDQLHKDIIAQDIECNRKIDKLVAEIRSLKAGRHE